MRYPEDKIKEAILHPDRDVRDAAIRYYYSSTSPDNTLMPLAIQAIERYGRTKAFSSTHDLKVFPQSEQTIIWVIAELQRDFEALPADRYFYYLNLSRLLCRADVRLIAPHAPDILEAPHFGPKEQTGFRERLEMFEWDAEKCWQELHQYCKDNRDKILLEDFDLGHALRTVEALARQPHDYERQIVALLAEKVHDLRHDARKWLQPLMANLAGAMRLQTTIPLLVANLGHQYSFLADESMFALAKIGSAEVIAAVCDLFPRGSSDFRHWASELFGKIHLDVTVQRVLDILPRETDLAIRLNLCEALLDQFSDEGIEPSRQLIREHELTPNLRHLRSNLITVCKLVGSRFPEFDEWQEQAHRDALEERAKSQEIEQLAFEAGGDMALLVRKLEAKIAERQMEIKRLEAKIAAHESLLAAKRPSPRSMPGPTKPNRIGRNEPCPCSSGKKFKNCCMNKQGGF